MAIGVLKVFDKSTRDNIIDVLVIRYIKHLEMDNLELAVHCKCERFVSSTSVQTILDTIWEGKRDDAMEMVKKIFLN